MTSYDAVVRPRRGVDPPDIIMPLGRGRMRSEEFNHGLAAFGSWLLARQCSPYTRRNYTHELHEAVTWFEEQGAATWADVDRTMLRAYVRWLKERELAPNSVARRISTLRSLGRYLAAFGLAKEHPFRTMVIPKVPLILPRILEPHEAERLMEAPPATGRMGLRNRAILEVLYATGVRVSELVHLDLFDLTMPRPYSPVGTCASALVREGKGGSDRVVLLGLPATEALDAYLSRARTEIKRRARSTETRAVWLNGSGQRLTRRSVERIVERYAAAAGLGRVTPHTLRHTFATHLLEGGADLRVIQELLGHANINSTERYTQVSPGLLRAAVDRLRPTARDGGENHGAE